MLKLTTPRIVWKSLEKYNGIFYTISLCRPPRGEIRAFLLEDGLTISASKIMNEMHSVVNKFIRTHTGKILSLLLFLIAISILEIKFPTLHKGQ